MDAGWLTREAMESQSFSRMSARHRLRQGQYRFPLPYPNIAQSADTSGGPTNVKVEGKMPMVKGAKYSKSSGDDVGSVGGFMSSVNQGEAEFMMYSFNVKFAGKNVCRLGDPLSHNKKNGMG